MFRAPRLDAAIFLVFTCFASISLAQTESATITGRVTDASNAVVQGAVVEIHSVEHGTVASTTTNSAGSYFFPAVQPGQYNLTVQRVGFRRVDVLGLTVNVQDHVEENFQLQVGSAIESITVNADSSLINTQDATVSTIIDRNFAENLPMNGRSFQTLIELTPGTVLTPSSGNDPGQFSVNGQRSNSNYWMVDGVSANVGMSPYSNPGGTFGGTVGSFSALGGTNSLVSVDAMQEFRIQTSTYAPEFGRTPGAQISILTRSGTNRFHGTAFDYLRNDAFDANDWFNASVTPALPKAKERQNDFGGTFSGPVLKDRMFFFFSYEGLRLRLPESALTNVPDLTARQNASPAMQPYLNVFPLPNGTDNTATGVAQFNASFSNPAALDAYSLRLDHKTSDKISIFGRYDYSPSKIVERDGGGGQALSDLISLKIRTQTATLGSTFSITPTIFDDVRFNYSNTNGSSAWSGDNFGGAVPLSSSPFPSPFTQRTASFGLLSLALSQSYIVGASSRNLLQQYNILDGFAVQSHSHSLKFGADYRRVSASKLPAQYTQDAFFSDTPSFESGNLFVAAVETQVKSTFLLRNLGLFAQDTWHVSPRFTLTYGVRWDTDFTPIPDGGPGLAAVTGYNLRNLAQLALLPLGTPPYHTRYGNVAPRIGAAYQLFANPEWSTVLRAGFGVFYDLASTELGNLTGFSGYPFSASNVLFGPGFGGASTFPLTPSDALPPQITVTNLSQFGNTLGAFDPNLRLPYTLQWSAALEQGIGRQQTISMSYIGSGGRRLIQSALLTQLNANFAEADLVGNTATSEYHALQVQFRKRISQGLQGLASYSWSHSIDDGSSGSYGNPANTLVPGGSSRSNRGPSDFDVRHALSAALTYQIPSPSTNIPVNAILSGWSIDNVVQAWTAPPVNVFYSAFSDLLNASTEVRPDEIPRVPLYLYGAKYPGGEAFNPAAFSSPPLDTNGNPLRQGNLGRNALRGFGAAQLDFSVHREFPIRESIKMQVRAELFNLLNHPNFAQPVGDLGSPNPINTQFGKSIQTLAQGLAGGNVGSGGFDPLYQIGGPRSIQFALKLMF